MNYGFINHNNNIKQTKSPMLRFHKPKQKKISESNRTNAAIFSGVTGKNFLNKFRKSASKDKTNSKYKTSKNSPNSSLKKIEVAEEFKKITNEHKDTQPGGGGPEVLGKKKKSNNLNKNDLYEDLFMKKIKKMYSKNIENNYGNPKFKKMSTNLFNKNSNNNKDNYHLNFKRDNKKYLYSNNISNMDYSGKISHHIDSSSEENNMLFNHKNNNSNNNSNNNTFYSNYLMKSSQLSSGINNNLNNNSNINNFSLSNIKGINPNIERKGENVNVIINNSNKNISIINVNNISYNKQKKIDMNNINNNSTCNTNRAKNNSHLFNKINGLQPPTYVEYISTANKNINITNSNQEKKPTKKNNMEGGDKNSGNNNRIKILHYTKKTPATKTKSAYNRQEIHNRSNSGLLTSNQLEMLVSDIIFKKK